MFKHITKRIIIYTAFLLFVVPVLIFLSLGLSSRNKNSDEAGTQNSETLENESSVSVPLPSKEDTIRTFCNLIDEGRISEAVGMMNIEEDTEKQGWGVNFNSISSFELIKINKSSIDESENSYEIDINVKIKDGKESYGWINGINKRWINLIEYEKGKYKIAGIATGP